MPNIIKKNKAASTLAENLPVAVDMHKLLDEHTQAVVTRKEGQLSELAQAEDVLNRRIAKLEQEIRRVAGEHLDKLKEAKKMLVAVKKKRGETGQSICITIEDALEFVPGRDLIEKKQYLLSQRNAEAV